MNYCEKCKKEFDVEEKKCPICNSDLQEKDQDSDMTMLGIL